MYASRVNQNDAAKLAGLLHELGAGLSMSTFHWTIIFNHWATIQFPIDAPHARKSNGRRSIKPLRTGSQVRPEAVEQVVLPGRANH
jgi:hypothetical protein